MRVRSRSFRSCALVLSGAVGCCCFALPARAAEPYADFLHALQQRGYGELAVGYLDSIKNKADLPQALRDEFDLEMHNSLRVAAAETTQADVRQQRLEAAQARMDAFTKSHPNHPGVAQALMFGANEPFTRGEKLLARAEATADATTRDKLLTDARAAFNEARPHIDKAFNTFKQRVADMAKLPPADGETAKKKRQEEKAGASNALLEAQYRLATLDYKLAQTYGPKDPQRLKSLEEASRGFSIIHGVGGFEGKIALMWDAKCAAELADLVDISKKFEMLDAALDMLDEARTGEPIDANFPSDTADFYGQIEQFNIQVILAKRGPKAALEEAAEWQKTHAAWKKFDTWHGVQLEIAKVHLSQTKNADAQKQGLAILDEIIKTNTEFKGAALIARRKATGGGGATPESVFDEKLEQIRSLHAADKLSEAIPMYAKILADWPADKDAKTKADVVKEYNQARYRQANKLYADKKVDEATALAETIIKEFPSDPAAVQASVLTVFCRLALFDAAKKEARPEALEGLKAAAEAVIKRFPDKPEAEDARLAVAKAYLKEEDYDHALPIFEQTKPESKQYGAAIETAAQIYLKNYQTEKKKPEKERNAEALKSLRDKTIERMGTSLKWQWQKLDPQDPLPAGLRESSLRLANLFIEAKQPTQALTLLEPLLADLPKQKPDSAGETTMFIYLITVRAYVDSNNAAKAAAVAEKLISSGQDKESVNNALVEFVKLLAKDLKAAETNKQAADAAGDPVAAVNAKTRYDAARQLWEKVVSQVAARREHSLAGALYMSDACATAGFRGPARDMLQNIVDKAKTDEVFAKRAEPYMTSVNTQLLRIRRDEGDFENALVGVEALIKKYPDALAPMMEKAKILQEWAEKKEPKKYPLAAAQWTVVRVALSVSKPDSDEFYDALYHVAECLFADARHSADKKKLQQAEQVLRSPLFTNPTLSSPEMVIRYNTLLKQIQTAAGK